MEEKERREGEPTTADEHNKEILEGDIDGDKEKGNDKTKESTD